MIDLRLVDYNLVSKYFVDFQRQSDCFEMPPETAQYIGIFDEDKIIGYFIIQSYDDGDVEINQGYLLPEYRHMDLSKDCTKALEDICKANGYKRMLLGTHNRFKAYMKFAKSLGYKPTHLVFAKEL